MDFEDTRRYYNRCAPEAYLEATDDRYVAIDELGSETEKVRGEDWGGKLVRRVLLSDRAVCELLTGLPGSGKSTELRRMAAKLAEQGFLPVVVDAEELIDLASPIDVADVVIAVVYSVEVEVLVLECKTREEAKEKAGQSSVFQRLKDLWKGIKIDVKGNREIELPYLGKLALEMKVQPTFRKLVRSMVTEHISTFLDEARRDLLRFIARAEKAGRKNVVVIFDSLEKLQGTSTTYEDTLQSAESVFRRGAPHLQLPVHAFYTVPPELMLRLRFENLEIMPMIKLRSRTDEPFEPGINAARLILVRRVPPPALQEMLGPAWEQRLRQIIEWSGGYPRELVRMLRSLIGAESFPVSEHAFLRVLHKVRDDYAQLIVETDYPWLARVALTKSLGLQSEASKATANRLLASNAILRYVNESAWFDLHPAVRALPGVEQEIARQRSASA